MRRLKRNIGKNFRDAVGYLREQENREETISLFDLMKSMHG